MRTPTTLFLPCCALLLAAAAPSANEDIAADLDGDGVPDSMTTTVDGGSGYHHTETCVTSGATGEARCLEWVETAYSPFEAFRMTDGAGRPVADGGALAAFLPPASCDPADPRSPDQAAMWRLEQPNPPGGNIDLPPLTEPGRPSRQANVCLTPEEGALLAGAFAWDASGTLTPEAAKAEGWTLVYLFGGEPELALDMGDLEIYRVHAAVAAYHARANVHRWLVNLADGSEEGFKVDRWQRVEGFRQDGPSFSFKVNHAGPPQRLVVDLRTWSPALPPAEPGADAAPSQ